MKPTIFLTLFAMTIAIPAQAEIQHSDQIAEADQIAEVRSTVTVHEPDHAFLEQVGSIGITQDNWDRENEVLTYQQAYKFTHHIKMQPSDWTHDFGKASNSVDITALTGKDFDGEYPLDVILRDRLKLDSLVIVKDGKLITEHYWNGMHKDKTHLEMSATKSYTGVLLSTFAAEGLVDMEAPLTDYLPELKGSGFDGPTVQEVSDMRSGICVEKTPGLLYDDKMTETQDWNGPSKYDYKNIIEVAQELRKRDDVETGEAFDYLCMNTEMVAQIIERITGKRYTEVLEERFWKRLGTENEAQMMTNRYGEAVASGGLNLTARDGTLLMDAMMNGGKNRRGEQIVDPGFIQRLVEGNAEVKSAWEHDSFAALLADAWYKDQIRVLNVDGHRFITFVGVSGQVTVGEPSTGIVIKMHGSQDEWQHPRTVSMTFLDVVPTLLKAAAK